VQKLNDFDLSFFIFGKRVIAMTDRYSAIKSGGIMPDEIKFGNPQGAKCFR
jgi:hypothetical protein